MSRHQGWSFDFEQLDNAAWDAAWRASPYGLCRPEPDVFADEPSEYEIEQYNLDHPAEEDASEQARRNLGEVDEECKACPHPAGGCAECIERGL